MANKTIFFDESGFTGGDLLNQDQPVFCIASSDIEGDRAGDFLKSSFPDYAGSEFKFQNIWRRPKNRKSLVKFSENIKDSTEGLFAYWIDKKFCVLTKLVDFLIEPTLHDAGYDFYADGYAPKFCNHFHFGITQFAPTELYDRTVQIYQQFARNPNEKTLGEMIRTFSVMSKSLPDEINHYYEMALHGALRFREFHDFDQHKSSSEIQLTTMIASVGYWRNKTDLDIAVVHDQSSNFFRQKRLWDAITRSDAPSQVQSLPGGGMQVYPLRVVDTIPADSKKEYSVQLCDVIAGLIAQRMRPMAKPEDAAFLQEVLEAGLGETLINGIRPEPNFPNGGPAKLSGPDAVDQLTAIIKGARDTIS